VFDLLQKAVKNYSKLVPRHGFDRNGKPRTDWINPDKDRDEAPDRRGQQTMFDLDSIEKEHDGKSRGYFDDVSDNYHEYAVTPLVSHYEKINPELAKRIKNKYEEYVFDQDTKELDLDVDYETAKHMKLIKDAPEYAKEYQKQYIESTDGTKKLINNRKKQMASKMISLTKGAELPLTGGRTGKMDGFTPNGFPIVKIGNNTQKIFWEEIRYPRK
jgi:hypothetical protein